MSTGLAVPAIRHPPSDEVFRLLYNEDYPRRHVRCLVLLKYIRMMQPAFRPNEVLEVIESIGNNLSQCGNTATLWVEAGYDLDRATAILMLADPTP
jgi:hypothetical protein